MTERDQDGAVDDGPGGDERGGDAHTRVVDTTGRANPGPGGSSRAEPTVHVPVQAGPPPWPPGSPAAGAGSPPPPGGPAAEPWNPWSPPTTAGPGSGYGAPTAAGPWAPPPPAPPGGHGSPETAVAGQWGPPPTTAHGAFAPASPWAPPGIPGPPPPAPPHWAPQPSGGPGAPAPTRSYTGYGSPEAPPYGAAGPAYAGAVGYPPGYGAPGPPGGGYPYPGAPTGPPGAPPHPPGFAPAPNPRRRHVMALVALVTVVALAAGGVVAYLYLRGGGGETPAEAVTLLAADLESENWTRAASRLHPDEVALGTDLGEVVYDELVRLEVLRADADRAAALTGTTFANLRFDDAAVENVRPNVAITKLVGGTITINQDVDAAPLTDSYKARAYPNGVPPARSEVIDIGRVVADQGRPIRVATVQVDGAWYASATYSLADYALIGGGEAWPQDTVAPRGATTAQDALRESLSAVFAQDARRLIELVPPRELAVLHDLGPLIVDNAGSSGSTGRLVDLAVREEEVPGGTALLIDRIVAENNYGDSATIVRDGDCLTVTEEGSYGGPTRLCAEDVAQQGVGSTSSLDPEMRGIVVKSARAALNTRIVVVEDGGLYYLSPVRTAVGLGIDVLKTLEPADLARLAEEGR